jgi:hypothetical protein
MEKGRTRTVGRIRSLSSQIRPDGAIDAMQIPARIYHRKSQKKRQGGSRSGGSGAVSFL